MLIRNYAANIHVTFICLVWHKLNGVGFNILSKLFDEFGKCIL